MGEEKDYKVINEKIVPKKVHPVRRFLKLAILIIFVAILFGLIERAVFESSGKLFLSLKNEKNKRQNVELTSSNKEIRKKEESIKQTEKEKEKKPVEAAKTIVKKDIKVVEKKIEASLVDYSNIMREFGKLAEENNKSVVEVQTVVMGTDWFENPYEAINTTSGFIMAIQESDVYIMTRYSKIKKAENIKISFYNGKILDGSLKNFNQDLDLAIVTANIKDLPEKEREDYLAVNIPSNEYINLGKPVMAIGNPDGTMYSVLFGNVVNTKRQHYQADYVFDAFYTDIRLVKESFSVVMDTEGKMLGISLNDKEGGSSKFVTTGRVVNLIEKMINNEPIPYLGIISKKFDGAEGKTGRNGGILIDKVIKGSPSDKAGFKEGDIIYEFGGKEVYDIVSYLDILESKKIGEMVKFKVYRVSRNVGSELDIEAIIGDSRGVK